jgi:predicted Zn-dependent protease
LYSGCDFRVFNASMAPNGMMQVWTGLLLRVQDEAQLAAVIGHEMAHYLERHTLQRFRDIRAKADLATFITMGLALAGPIGSVAGLAAQLALVASVFAFSREQERDADRIGSDLMGRAGFAPGRAADVWEQLIAELAVSTIPAERDPFSATHPAMSERVENLRALAADRPGGETAPDRLRAALAGIRTTLFQDEIRLRQPARSLAVFEQLRRAAPEDAELAFYTGEVHRLRNQDGDNRLARDAYERAIALPRPPTEAYRSLGLVARRDGDTNAANTAFRRYLDLSPQASDRKIVLSYITPTS